MPPGRRWKNISAAPPSHNRSTLTTMDRRTFLGSAAAAFAASSWAASDPLEWFDRPMRWAQLTLVEDDPAHYDVNFWIEYFRRTHSDAACLSAGGCVAFYPTKVP